MCNLSQGIKEQAYAEGIENGIAKGVAKTIIKMYRKVCGAEQIGDLLDMEVEQIREIIENE